MTTDHTHRPVVSRPAASYAILALVPALMLAGCGGSEGTDASSPATATSQAASDSRVADSANVDASLEDNPCKLLTADLVASVFEVPAAELEQGTTMSSTCTYTRESGDQELKASVDVDGVHDDAETASSRFRSVTAGMSGADLDRTMDGIKKEAARESGVDGATADAVVGAAAGGSKSGSKGIQFEDVAGVGDEARMALTVGAGDLYVRVGNLNFTVSAYSGPGMTMPTEMKPGSILAASRAWQKDTLPQRKEDAIKLGKAVAASL